MDGTIQYTGIAQRIFEHMTEAHRGAFALSPGMAVIFGNDGYSSEHCDQARQEVHRLREALKSEGVRELAFDLDRVEGYTWAMIVETDAVEWLTDQVWKAWGCKRDELFRQIQESIADRVIEKRASEVVAML